MAYYGIVSWNALTVSKFAMRCYLEMRDLYCAFEISIGSLKDWIIFTKCVKI